MSNGMPWIRFHLYDWISGTDGMTLEQRGAYMTLLVRMYDKKAPIKEDFETLSRACNCSQKKFATIVEYLMRNDKLIEIDGGLWNTRVEEELKDFADKKDHISQIRSEAGKKGAQAKNNTKQCVNDFAEANDKQNVFFAEANDKQNDFFAEAKSKQNVFFAEANDKQNQAIKNQNKNNIYKKNKTIVLSKKEIDFEDLETTDLDDEPTEVAAVESQPEQIETIAIKQPLIHEQESVPKKAKRVKTDRGCRLPADFEPDYDFALAEGLPPERIKVEIAKFQDYWNAKTGKDASKRDWQATWRNWVRNSKTYQINQQGGNYGKTSTKHTEQQRGWSYRVAQHMSNIKNSDSVYKFLFEDDNTTPIPLENRTKAIECRSGESYLVG
ncbi:YdaU family protein [Bartonella krasnovii]|uniref:YdaU family protein n=1 Tax=Bartonella krasnovii TaxID=2267275 RepID=UPI000E724297|nr:YdaU family protein [Bartonella krasnovii]UNF37780.1 YdaU family protein [Bartonella krasnovii]UNF42730.1 YdaU family protein [Bartonella krasnovii]UNF42991.1 YdaU family protein [Bartonella krasnovii]UNF54236.1 YdaU family protein [Bartonella krasnovii]UNF55940.1 YdaU family protein [Bartonella krasnovii]